LRNLASITHTHSMCENSAHQFVQSAALAQNDDQWLRDMISPMAAPAPSTSRRKDRDKKDQTTVRSTRQRPSSKSRIPRYTVIAPEPETGRSRSHLLPSQPAMRRVKYRESDDCDDGDGNCDRENANGYEPPPRHEHVHGNDARNPTVRAVLGPTRQPSRRPTAAARQPNEFGVF
jgi:hypothetical protein